MKTKVLLADDHQIVIEGLRAVLGEAEHLEIVGEVGDGEKVVEALSSGLAVDVVVLDINMPVMDGFACAKKIKRDFHQVKIIVLTMYSQKSFIDEIVKIGIDGCLLKNNTGNELVEAIDRVVKGKAYFDRIHSFNDESSELHRYKLGERELEIIKLIADGLTSAQISERLFISEHTVKTHRKNILRKTNLHSTAQLLQFALNNQII